MGGFIEYIICACGNKAEWIDPTDQEEKDYGCSRRRRCCVSAYQCEKGHRTVVKWETPENIDG